jgi:hypothetical protein
VCACARATAIATTGRLTTTDIGRTVVPGGRAGYSYGRGDAEQQRGLHRTDTATGRATAVSVLIEVDDGGVVLGAGAAGQDGSGVDVGLVELAVVQTGSSPN